MEGNKLINNGIIVLTEDPDGVSYAELTLTDEEIALLCNFRKLNATGKATASEKLDDLAAIHKYTLTAEELRKEEEERQAARAKVQAGIDMAIDAHGEECFLYSELQAIKALSLDEHGRIDEWAFASNCLDYGYYCGMESRKA